MNLLRGAALLLACIVASPASAQDFPSRPIRLIVPYAASGNVDVTARRMAPALSQELGQQVIVENRPGAGGALGLIALSKTPADGYTIALTGTTTLTIVPILFPKMATYNPKEFAPISLVSEAPLLLVLGPATSVKTVKELIELAQAKPGTLTMGSAGNGTTNHLVGELFKANAGIDFVHVPYKGSGEALNDLIGGHIDFIFDQIPASIGFVKAGTARALGLTLAQRSPILPEIPTFAEQGWPDVQASTTLGMVAPAGNAAGGGRQAERRDRPRAQRSEDQGGDRPQWRSTARQHAGPVQAAARSRSRGMDPCDRQGEHQDRAITAGAAVSAARGEFPVAQHGARQMDILGRGG